MSFEIEKTSSSASKSHFNDNGIPIRDKVKHKATPPFPGFGITCCILSGVVFSFNAMIVKLIESNSAIQLSASRCIVQFLILLPYVSYIFIYQSHDILGPPHMFKFLVLRGFTGSTAAICLYQSVQIISLGDAVTLSFSNVIFAGLLGYVFLKESFSLLDGAMSIVAMAGIILIAKPSFIFRSFEKSEEDPLGVFFGVAAGVFAGITFVIIRKLGKKTHAGLTVLYYSLCGSISSLCIMIITKSYSLPCQSELIFIFLLGVTGVSAQLIMTLALHYERANTFAVLRSFQIVFIFFLQVSFLLISLYLA